MSIPVTYTHQARAALYEAAQQEHDFAGWLAGVLAAVAAHLGSTEALFEGRPGSWEAGHLRALLVGTVGEDDENLSHYR